MAETLRGAGVTRFTLPLKEKPKKPRKGSSLHLLLAGFEEILQQTAVWPHRVRQLLSC